jgi:hypothetical protein
VDNSPTSYILVLLMAIDVVAVVDLSFGGDPALLLYPRGRGYKESLLVGYNLWGLFCRHLFVIWAYVDPL